MGYRISWLAVPIGAKDRLLDILELTDTGEPDEANEAPFSAATLPTGWTVLWSNDQRYAASHAGALSRVLAPVIAVEINETCMHSTASLFDGGERRWRVHHEGDERIDFLQKEGPLPPDAPAIEAQARAAQAEEDRGAAEVDHIFEVPLEIARAICGYKHDRAGFDWGEPAFTGVYARSAAAQVRSRSLWSRVFGG